VAEVLLDGIVEGPLEDAPAHAPAGYSSGTPVVTKFLGKLWVEQEVGKRFGICLLTSANKRVVLVVAGFWLTEVGGVELVLFCCT